MADLLPPSIVEMITEIEKDLQKRERVYRSTVYVNRFSLERAERRLEVCRAVVSLLRERASGSDLAALEEHKQRKQKHREADRVPQAA